ncbi:MAG: response regulator [Chloroflexota bacterium]
MTKARILVVDDDRPTVLIISSVLEKQGFQVFSACEGIEALRLAVEAKPHLIILDIMMPGMDGYQVARRLKRSPETADIPVLMLSAKGDITKRTQDPSRFASRVQDRLEGFDSGAVDFLTKPVKGKDLVRRVKALLWAGGMF